LAASLSSTVARVQPVAARPTARAIAMNAIGTRRAVGRYPRRPICYQACISTARTPWGVVPRPERRRLAASTGKENYIEACHGVLSGGVVG
jgi:hypothetical protein